MNEQQNVKRVQEIYAAFGRGDVAFIVSQLTDDIHWVSHFDSVVPWSGDFSGKERIPHFSRQFFSPWMSKHSSLMSGLQKVILSCHWESLDAVSAPPTNVPAHAGSSSGSFVMPRSFRTSSFMILP